MPVTLRPAALAVLAALILATLACNTQSNSAGAKPDSGLYAYLPPDATLIAGARLTRLRKSPLYKTFRDQLPQQALAYEKEAAEIVIASDGVHNLVLARGKFNKQQLERDLAGNGTKGTPNIESLAPDLIAIADSATIADARKANQVHASSPLAAQIPNPADLWLVSSGRLPFQFPDRSNLTNINRLAQDLRLAVLSFQVTDSIQADAHLDFATDAASEQAQTALRGFLGLARLSTPTGQEQLLEVLDRILITRDKSSVSLKADWQPNLVQAVLGMLPRR